MTFRVGQKVVCVDDSGFVTPDRSGYGDEIFPVRGEIYTIRQLCIHPSDGGNSVRLIEITNRTRLYLDGGFWEPCFWAGRFRPLVTKQTDISIFTALLNRAPERIDA